MEFRSKSAFWLVTLLGIGFYVFSLFFLFYATLLTISEFHRTNFTNFIYGSVISAIVVFFIGKSIISMYGAEALQINETFIKFKKKFSSSKKLPIDDILHIKVTRPNPVLELLPFSKPTIVIITHDKVYRIKTIKYIDIEGLISFFENQDIVTNDDFALYYHRSKNYLYEFLFRFSQDTPGVLSLIIISIFTFLALWGGFAMIISPTDTRVAHTLFLRNPEFQNWALEEYDYGEAFLHPPNSDFWFGTDFIGRDLFSRLVYGTTYTFIIAITGASISIIFSVGLGLLSALNPGSIDNVIIRISDALLSFPPYIFLIIFSAISIPLRAFIPGGFFIAVYTGMAFVIWPSGARLIRSEVRVLMNSEYMLASIHLGAKTKHLLIRHIIPQILPTILLILTYQITDIIIGTTLLGYIGFASESTLTWGSDLSHALFGFTGFIFHWWTLLFPSLFIFLLVLGLTLLSDSLKDNLDTTQRGGIKSLPYEVRKELNI